MQLRKGSVWIAVLALSLLGAVLLSNVAAHESRLVGDDEYYIVVGYAIEPAFTDERNGLDLLVRTADGDMVPFLEDSLKAELIAPDGKTKRTLKLRGKHGEPGRYTDDFVLTQPGLYQVRVWGEINGKSVDETFTLHEVGMLADLEFPPRQ